MGRQARLEYAGAMYHLMCRGNRREDIFENDDDRLVFLDTLSEVCERTGWRVCAYVLMSNHYHMVVQTPEANLVAGMKWFQGTYTKRYNARNRQWGHLFQGRYKSLVIDADDPDYFRTACDYVHLNPARAHLVGGRGQVAFRDYAWSSCRYLSAASKADLSWLDLGRVVEAHSGRRDERRSRMEYLQYLEGRAREERKMADRDGGLDEYKALRRGWCLGGEEFKQELRDRLIDYLDTVNRDSIVGEPRRMHDEHEALELLCRACEIVGLNLHEKDRLRKSDSRKELVAWLVAKKTAVTQEWIASHLSMGSRSNVGRGIQRVENGGSEEIVSKRNELGKMSGCVH